MTARIHPSEIIPTVELPDLAPLLSRTLVKQAEEERLARRREEDARELELQTRRKKLDAALGKIAIAVSEAESLPVTVELERVEHSSASTLHADVEYYLCALRWPALVRTVPDGRSSLAIEVTIHMPKPSRGAPL